MSKYQCLYEMVFLLKTPNVFVGLATVVLFFSLAVMVIATSSLNGSGKRHFYGIQRLLWQARPEFNSTWRSRLRSFTPSGDDREIGGSLDFTLHEHVVRIYGSVYTKGH